MFLQIVIFKRGKDNNYCINDSMKFQKKTSVYWHILRNLLKSIITIIFLIKLLSNLKLLLFSMVR